MGRFAIGARVALLWQHNANPITSLRPSRDMTTLCERPAGWCLRAPLAADWRVTGAFSKLRAVYGKWAWLARR